jgi:hypothetical protein
MTKPEDTCTSVQTTQAVHARPTGYRDPVFVLSPARSYSTVTIALLAGHPEIYGFPELGMFSSPTVDSLLNAKPQDRRLPPFAVQSRLSGLLRVIADLDEGEQSEDAMSRAHAWLTSRSAWTTRELMQYLLARVYPCVGVEKSPDTANSDTALSTCLEFPGARFIHLTRHPVTAQHSMDRFWRKGLELWDPERSAAVSEKHMAVAMASAWYLSHRRIAAALRTLPDEQWMRVRAEDLIREPRSWLPRIAKWLGLAWSDEILARMLQTERWRFANMGPPGKHYGGGDPGFMLSPVLRNIDCPLALDSCASLKLPQEMRSHIEALARYLGY